MHKAIGVDLGGTNIRVAHISNEGTILKELSSVSYAQEGPRKVLSNMISLIRQLGTDGCDGIGIGIPGPVDVEEKIATMSTNLPGFKNFRFVSILEEEFHLPVYLDNDANVAGLAEALVGAGQGKGIVYYVTHSTGIGGALIVRGQTVAGRNGYAGEIGNIIVERNGVKISHLNAGALENLCSGTAICRIGQQRIGERVQSAKDVFALAKEDDPIALGLIDEMAENFAIGLSCIAHVVDPHVIVIGGGCSNASEQYFPQLKNYYNQHVHEGMRDVPIVKAKLHEPGVIGAGLLVKSALEHYE